MKRVWITTLITAAIVLAVFFRFRSMDKSMARDALTIGFLFEDDESTPYTYNFALTEEALLQQYPDKLTIYEMSNVSESDTKEPLADLIRKGCDIIFTNSHSDVFLKMAAHHPEVEFCQVSYLERAPKDPPANYHTFKGEIYQGRYVSGIVAGMKLRELIDHRVISADQALVGYVGANASAAVISGYTAFLLGVRSVAPEATMQVRYTNSWGNYAEEKACAKELIDDGCLIISQHSDTIGPAIACEEAVGSRRVYFIGYNYSMLDIAPTTALISTRINWEPYVTEAVGALLAGKTIESYVEGHVHENNDISAGFDHDWVQMMELNRPIAAKGTEAKMAEAIEAFKKGNVNVFSGDYVGISPADPEDTWDLRNVFIENAASSSPSFHYVLKDIITIKEHVPLSDR